jgi:glycosyltransferase involved in cell wall biosynthesis
MWALQRSIQSALTQSISDIKVIVVDDNSDGDTEAVVNGFNDKRLYLISHNKNEGGSAARNTGADASTGRYVAFLDADDEWLRSKLEEQINYLQNKDECWGACYCDTKTVRRGLSKDIRRNIYERGLFHSSLDQEESQIPKEGGEELIPFLLKLKLSLGGSSTLLVKRDVFESIGGFDESFPRHQDLEFSVRLAKHKKIAYLDEPLVRKFESDPPKPEKAKAAKKEYLSKFRDEIESIEDGNETSQIESIHRHDLGENYLRHGYLFDAIEYMNRSQLQLPTDLIPLVWKYSMGITDRISKKSS